MRNCGVKNSKQFFKTKQKCNRLIQNQTVNSLPSIHNYRRLNKLSTPNNFLQVKPSP